VSVTNYATYKNDPNLNLNGEGYNVTTKDVSGEWVFIKEETNINYSYRFTEPIHDQPVEESYSHSGLLVMDGRQKFFAADGELDYELFDIHERKGKKMTVVYQNLYLIDYGTIVFIELENQ